jgi:RHS repeat-associated protein
MTISALCANEVYGNRWRFTGKERDTESGNDYFGARYYASSMGRFLSPDWAAKIEPVPYAKLDNPQSLNLYSYVWNNPLSRNDPDGHEVDLGNSEKKLRDEAQKRILSNVSSKERGLFKAATDKNGTTRLVLDKAAAANFEGKHSAGYGMLNEAINAKATATVTVGDYQTVGGVTTYDVRASGGGKMVPRELGRDTAVLLSEHPDPANSAPAGIIAGHELLGHARLYMEGRPSGEPEAQAVENKLRKEQNLPPRAKDDY